jgi:hypothetical protein
MRVLLVAVLAACSGDDTTKPEPTPTDTGTPPPTDTGTPPLPGPDLVIEAGNVYSVGTTWALHTEEVRASFDLLVNWSSLTTDAWGDPVEPGAIDTLFLLEVLSKPSELAPRLAADDLGDDLISVWTADVGGGPTYAHLTDFVTTTGGGTVESFDPDPYLVENADKSWVVGFGRWDGDRPDLRTIVVLEPKVAGTETSVDARGSSVSWSMALDGAALQTAEGWALYTVDWSGLAEDALGKPYDKTLGDELFVARWATATLEDLAASPFDWASTADAWYAMDVANEDSARLDLAKDPGGAVFPGFTEGTWVMGVRCGTCLSPFPLWVATVDVVSGNVTTGTGG